MTFEGRGRYDRNEHQCPEREKGIHKWKRFGVGRMGDGLYIVRQCKFCGTFSNKYLKKMGKNDENIRTVKEIMEKNKEDD